MTTSLGTKRVNVLAEIDLDDGSEIGARVPVTFEAEGRIDRHREVPVALRFRHGDMAHLDRISVRLRYGDQFLGPLQEMDDVNDGVAIPRIGGRADRRRATEITAYDLTQELTVAYPHDLTGSQYPNRPEFGLTVRLDGNIHAERRGDESRYDLTRLTAHGERFRRLAAERLLFREPEGWFIPQSLPSVNLHQNAFHDPAWRLVLHTGVGRSETRFGLRRFDEARAFCRFLNGGVDGGLAGEIVEVDHSLLPLGDDFSPLATQGAPYAVAAKVFDPSDMPASLVVDWHAARNGRSIVESEGRPGVERVLTSCLRLADHIEASGIELERVREWAVFKARILFEGVEPVPAPPDFRP